MLVSAALCWWNERPEDLDKCVRGLATVCDKVVALDGAYARYPKATPHSPPDQLVVIRDAAKDVGLDCLIVQPDRLWAGQVEKRSSLLALASVGAEWLCTVDADHVISGDRNQARAFMERAPHDVIDVPFFTPVNPKRPLDDSAVGDWHKAQMGDPQLIPQLWRALPGMKVERFHWWISAIQHGQRKWLWGGDGSRDTEPHENMPYPYRVDHLTLMRTPEQIKLSRGFLNDRIKVVEFTGQEDDLPGLAPPVFDYRAVPA